MLFSVIVPMYNVEQYAARCLDSIENQIYRDFELILVDDGSTDRTPIIIDEYSRAHGNTIAVHKPNGGLTSARKAGALLAKGEYVAIIDGDDWVDSNYLLVFSQLIKSFNPDVAVCGFKRVMLDGALIDGNMGPLTSGFFERKEIESRILSNLFSISPTVWSKVFRREQYVKVQLNLNNSISMGEDGCISYPLIAFSERIAIVDTKMYYYRQNAASLTKSRNRLITWEGCEARIAHLKGILPIDKYNLNEQLACYVTHACFNVLLTNFRNRSYFSVRNEALKKLNQTFIMEYLDRPLKHGKKRDRFARLLLKYRMLIIIKLISMF